jgi:hypothetical protein
LEVLRMTELHLRNYDNFWVELDLDQVLTIPLPKWRKICKTLLTLDCNETAKLRVLHWFPAAILAADEDLTRAIKDEEREHINTKGLRFDKLRQAKDHNKDLARRVYEVRRKHQALVKRYEEYKNILED